MKLRKYTDGVRALLILNTGGREPDPRERGLFLCRSLTLPADVLLLGPLDRAYRFQVLDLDGLPRTAGPSEAAAFAAFLGDTGYGTVQTVTDGNRRFSPTPEETARWRMLPAPEGKALLELLGISA